MTTATTNTPAPADKPQAESKQLSLKERLARDMHDPTSDLRNQATVQDIVDFQLLSSTPAEVIAAMSGYSLDQLGARAKEVGVTLKGSLAGDFRGKI